MKIETVFMLLLRAGYKHSSPQGVDLLPGLGPKEVAVHTAEFKE